MHQSLRVPTNVERIRGTARHRAPALDLSLVDRPLSGRLARPPRAGAGGTPPVRPDPAGGADSMANQHGAGGSGSFFRACILLLLAERPSHGYDLLERLAAFGFDSGDSGWLYRTLRAFERDGSVDSTWEISSSGPPRRVYALTPRGSVRLDSATNAVRASKRAIDDYLERTARAGRSSRGRHTGPRDPGNPGGAGG